MTNFLSKVSTFMEALGFSKDNINDFQTSGSLDFATFIQERGAKKLLYRPSLRSIEGVGHTGILLTGGMSVITTTLPNGNNAVLIQHREKNEIGLPGGGSEVWQYKNTVAEPFILTAYREFKEEVGLDLTFELEFYEEHSSTILYPNGDVTFSPCVFYKADVPYETACRYAMGGSSEGKMELLDIARIDDLEIFSNHLPAFKKLQKENNTFHAKGLK